MEEEVASAGRVQKHSGSYTFRIEGYSGLSANVGISTESPEFRLCGHCWQLRIFPGGSLETHKNFVSYYLASKSTKQARASYKLSVTCQISDGTDETFSSSGVRLFEAKGTQIDGWGRDKFMLLSTLKDPSLGFYVSDTVIFKVNITVYGALETADVPVVSTRSLNHSNITLSECMYTLYQEASRAESSADLVIVAGESQTPIYCHRSILRARSPVFKAMLSTPITCDARTFVPLAPSVPMGGGGGDQEQNMNTTISSVDSDRSKIFTTALSQSPGTGATSPRSSRWSNETGDEGEEMKTEAKEDEKEEEGKDYRDQLSSFPYPPQGEAAGGTGEAMMVVVPRGDDAIETGQESKGRGASPFEPHSSSNSNSNRVVIDNESHQGQDQDKGESDSQGVRFMEAGEGTVYMPEIEAATVHELLTFIYTDALSSMTVLDTMAVQLFVAAAKYQVSKLLSIVEDYLCLQVALETAVPLLQVAHAYDATKLRNRCLQCIVDNSTEVVKLKEYQCLSTLDGGPPPAMHHQQQHPQRLHHSSSALLNGAGTLGLRETIDRAMQSAAGLPMSPQSADSSQGSTGATWRNGVSEEVNTSSSSLRVAPAINTNTGPAAGGGPNATASNVSAMADHGARTEAAFNSYRASRRTCIIC
jgi:hypothetical protein